MNSPATPSATGAITANAAGSATACANCGTPGAGRYCSHCGQRMDVHLHSVGHFTSEAAEVLTHSDSSLWGTLWPLLARPGWLTREFVAGRRARYLHPFRLYLVASVILYLALQLQGGQELDLRTTAAKPATTPGDSAWITDTDCNGARTDLPVFKDRAIAACHSLAKDGGQELGRAITHNIGRAMFVFLPLLAAFMKLLYWRPRRWYLEHLLLLLHNHAFLYLWFALLALSLHWLPAGWVANLLGLAGTLYALRYIYRSLRSYYAQGRARTVAKFLLMGTAYCVAGVAMLALTTLVSALTLAH